MKNYLYLFLVGALVTAFAACNKKSNENGSNGSAGGESPDSPEIVISDDAIKLGNAEAVFYGTYYTQTDVNEILLNLWSEGMTFEGEYITSAGIYVGCDLFLDSSTLSSGTFVAASTATEGQPSTVGKESQFLDVYEDGDNLGSHEGTVEKVEIQKTDKGFKVAVQVLLDGESMQVWYEGPIEITDASDGGDEDDGEDEEYDDYAYESETTTAQKPVFENAVATNYGKLDEEIEGETIYLELFDKDTLQYTVFELYAPEGSTELPAGEYKAAETGVFTWYPGMMFYGIFPVGTYSDNLVGEEEEVFWWQTGTLKVVKNTDDTYTISTNDMKSYYGSTMEFSYTGKVEYSVEEYTEGDDDDYGDLFAPKRVQIKRHTANVHKPITKRSSRLVRR